MYATRYETHNMPHPLLPFIFHRRFEVTSRNKHPNWHENIEILQAMDGDGYAICGARQLPLNPDTLVIVNADTLHNIVTNSRLVYRCFIIDNSFFLSNGVPIGSLYFQELVTDPKIRRLFDAVALAYEQFSTEDYRSVLTIRTAALQLVQALCRDCTTHRPEQPDNERIKQAVTYLRKHFSDPISLDEISRAVGISKFHLSRQFKLLTGNTVVQTLNLIRCTEARRRIEEGTPINAAATDCGFENLSYFTRTFKKYLGTLPSEHVPR